MLISLCDRTFRHGVDDHLVGGIQGALHAHQMGLHGLVISPQGLARANDCEIDPRMKADLALVHRNWIEGQALIRKATRVAEITGDIAEHGTIEGNRFYVYAGHVNSSGLTREATYVTESLATDGSYLRLLMRISLDMNDMELRRFWYARPEQGGGGATFAYVQRFVEAPNPMFILCDRDSPDDEKCGPTAQRCIDALLAHNLYLNSNSAMSGGFSRSTPAFGFRIMQAFEMENLILPHMAELYFDYISSRATADNARALIRERFPRFPTLSNEEADIWLRVDFKNFFGRGKIFGSDSLREIAHWSTVERKNFESLRTAARLDFSRPAFMLTVLDVVRDIWTTGARQNALS